MRPFEKLREDLWHRICEAKSSFLIFWKLEAESPFRTKHLQTMNAYVSFFVPLLDAHDMMWMMRLSAIHDAPKKGERNTLMALYHLVVEAKLAPHKTSKVTLEEIRDRLFALRKMVDPLQKLRSHYYAHRLSYPLEDKRANALTYDEINAILLQTEKVYNDLSMYIDGTDCINTSQPTEHTEAVLETLFASLKGA